MSNFQRYVSCDLCYKLVLTCVSKSLEPVLCPRCRPPLCRRCLKRNRGLNAFDLCEKCRYVSLDELRSHVLKVGKYKGMSFDHVASKDPQYARFYLVFHLGADLIDPDDDTNSEPRHLEEFDTVTGSDFYLTFGPYIGLTIGEVIARGDADYLVNWVSKAGTPAREDIVKRKRGRDYLFAATGQIWQDELRVAEFVRFFLPYLSSISCPSSRRAGSGVVPRRSSST
jgi:hypothetical protein